MFIFASECWYSFSVAAAKITTELVAINNINVLFYGSGGQKSKINTAVFLLEVLGEDVFPCLFQLSEVACLP